jgi:hypothetical protein
MRNYEPDDLVMYAFSPRAEDPSDMMVTSYDPEWHEELTSRRNYLGCRLLMRAAEIAGLRDEIVRERGFKVIGGKTHDHD